MTTVTHNSTTPSVSVTAASGNNPPQLVATLVPDEQRISFWPQHFGLIPQWVTLEPRVFGWMDRLCEDYCGGIWNLYTLNNGGAFMAPEPDDDDDETWVLFNAMNGTRSQLINSIDILLARRATGLMTRDNYRTVNNITLGKYPEAKQ
ncbi:antirestriction protein [Escherichia coli]